jgi:hypothetical protein
LLWVVPINAIVTAFEVVFLLCRGWSISRIWRIYIKSALDTIHMTGKIRDKRREISKIRKRGDISFYRSISLRLGKVVSFRKVGLPELADG